MSVHEHDDEHYEARFIPDPFISGLKDELRVMDEEQSKLREDRALTKAEKDAAKEKRKLDSLYSSLDDDDDDDY